MKRILLSVVVSVLSIPTFSQISQGKLSLSVNGNYMKNETSNGVTTNRYITDGQYLTVNTSIEYFLNNCIAVGFGLDYLKNKEERENILNVHKFIQGEDMNINSSCLLPSVIGGYYFKISDRLYLNTNLKMGYSQLKTHLNTSYNWAQLIESGGLVNVDDLSYAYDSELDSKYDFFDMQLSPVLNYYFSDRFGVCLGFGGIEYSILDWAKENSEWVLNFNPNYWKLGIKIMI